MDSKLLLLFLATLAGFPIALTAFAGLVTFAAALTGFDALAGLRSKLEGDLAKEPAETRKGYRVLDSDFMSVQQAIGVRKRKPEGEGIGCSAAQVSEHLDSFVCQLLQKQQIEQLIEEHKVKGKLFPAKL